MTGSPLPSLNMDQADLPDSLALYGKDFLPDGNYEEYEKVRPTKAIRMPGAFQCMTSEGNVASCSDGWLAVDSQGHPYPINAQEFDLTYRPVRPAHEDAGH